MKLFPNFTRHYPASKLSYLGELNESRENARASRVEMKIYERWLQAFLSSAPRSHVLARLASLAQIGRACSQANSSPFDYTYLLHAYIMKII